MSKTTNGYDIDGRVLLNYSDLKLLDGLHLQYTDNRTNKTHIVLWEDFESMLEEEEKILHENDLVEKIAKRVVEMLEEKHII